MGKLGREVSVEQGYAAARLTALAMLGSLQRALGDLDRITAWTRVFGMVNSAPGFNKQPSVINGFSDLILELFGPEIGAHARSAVGLAELPFDIPVEIEGVRSNSGTEFETLIDRIERLRPPQHNRQGKVSLCDTASLCGWGLVLGHFGRSANP
ncbi:MAG: RidA family protein [Rhodocyclaceae bacterium]|nr:RidA family protein [Rhodocyclaceae bacterium]